VRGIAAKNFQQSVSPLGVLGAQAAQKTTMRPSIADWRLSYTAVQQFERRMNFMNLSSNPRVRERAHEIGRNKVVRMVEPMNLGWQQNAKY
jgi:hypothetical protein